MARRLTGRPPRLARDLEKLLDGLRGKQREVMLRCALEELVRKVPPEQCLHSARSFVEGSDAELQRQWFAALSEHHEAARVPLAVCQHADFARPALWLAMRDRLPEGPQLARTLLAGVERRTMRESQTLGTALVKGLAGCQATREAAGLLQSWELEDPVEALKAVLDNPGLGEEELARLAFEAVPAEDAAAQRRLLDELCARPDAPGVLAQLRDAHEQIKTSGARSLYWELAAQAVAGTRPELGIRLQARQLSPVERSALQRLEAAVQRHQAEREARRLSEGLRARSHQVELGSERVVVGGVSLRRRSESV